MKELLVGLAFALRPRRAVRGRRGRPARCSTRSIGFSFGAIVDPVTGNQSAVLPADVRADRGDRSSSRSTATRWVDRAASRRTFEARAAAGRARRRLAGRRAPSSRSRAIFVSALEVAAPVLHRADHHRRRVRRRHAGRAADERLRGRLPGQGRSSACCVIGASLPFVVRLDPRPAPAAASVRRRSQTVKLA